MNWFEKLNGLEFNDGSEDLYFSVLKNYRELARKTLEWYDELKKDLTAQLNDLDKLNLLKYNHKEFIKTIFYKVDLQRNKQGMGLADVKVLQIEKEMLAEIEYLEFKIKNSIDESIEAEDSRNQIKQKFQLKPKVMAKLDEMLEDRNINLETPAVELCKKLRPIFRVQLNLYLYDEDTLDSYVKEWRRKNKKKNKRKKS